MSNIPSYCPYQGATVPPPWSRATLSCINYQNPNIGVNELDMRRKAEILQYNKNQNNLTKKQAWSMLNKGQLTRKKVWATQGINYTNPNVNKLKFENIWVIYPYPVELIESKSEVWDGNKNFNICIVICYY